MNWIDPTRWVAVIVAAGAVSLGASATVFVHATAVQLALATVTGAVPLLAAFAVLDAGPGRLGRFVVVFYGSLVGLTLVVTAVPGPTLVDASLASLAGVEFAVGVNLVMAVLVGGALSLSHYGVFRWADRGRSDRIRTNDGHPTRRVPPG